MSIRLSDLERDERTVVIVLDEKQDKTLSVTYKPSQYTPEVEERAQGLFDSRQPTNAVAQLLASVLVRWDLLDDKDQPIATTLEELKKRPSWFLQLVISEINADLSVDKDAKKNYGGG